jgi:putative Mg2+ transporter-C (MgtC) family protein
MTRAPDDLTATGPSSAFWSTSDQWALLPPVLLALLLTALIGIEREARAKSAGVRTHTLVGFGAAVFMIVSKYGFADIIAANHISLDPSRIAAQIVSGIGFIGGGLIFVQRSVVRGLTTAATIWLAAAVGTASGAWLPVLAVAATAAHYLITVGFPPLARLLSRFRRHEPSLYLDYFDGRGILRTVLAACTERGWTVQRVEVDREATTADGRRTTAVVLRLAGRGDLTTLAAELSELPGIRRASTSSEDQLDE